MTNDIIEPQISVAVKQQVDEIPKPSMPSI